MLFYYGHQSIQCAIMAFSCCLQPEISKMSQFVHLHGLIFISSWSFIVNVWVSNLQQYKSASRIWSVSSGCNMTGLWVLVCGWRVRGCSDVIPEYVGVSSEPVGVCRRCEADDMIHCLHYIGILRRHTLTSHRYDSDLKSLHWSLRDNRVSDNGRNLWKFYCTHVKFENEDFCFLLKFVQLANLFHSFTKAYNYDFAICWSWQKEIG